MKFTVNWLEEYVPLHGIATEKLADDLTMLGLEVDSVTQLFNDLTELKTALVISTRPHPDADKLTLCEVAVGTEKLQIVCGAPNVRAGLCTVVALPGTTLPGDFSIKKSKVRGVVSEGMLCSERELGLSDEHTGIMELPDGTPHGEAFLERVGLKDTQIEVDLTPNRPDCASVIGIAREIAGINRRKLTVPFKNSQITGDSSSFTVEVQSPELCPRYSARLIRGVKIGPSPWWLRKRLLSVGMRPINNVVDITNLVMLEYGQPLHAFDFDRLSGRSIIVRTPRPDEKEFTTLDKVKRQLESDMLMICDGAGPVAVAGVMGGLDSEVTDTTTNVLIESACFNSVSIRRTARRLNLASEASYRFERGVDPGGTVDAMQRAISLIAEVAGGSAEESGRDVYEGRLPLATLTLRIARTAQLLGVELTREQVGQMLESIEIRCQDKDEDTLVVNPPSFRIDLEREADLVEEVARLIGYNEIPSSLPEVDLCHPQQDRQRLVRSQVRSILAGAGFSEAINYSFTSSAYEDLLRLTEDDQRRKHVRIVNPISEEQDVMRTSLLPGLLENVRRNINFQKTSCRLFEIGKVFFAAPEQVLAHEPARLAGVLTGNRYGDHPPLHFKAEEVDIYDAKGAVETLLQELRVKEVTIGPAANGQLEPFAHEHYTLAVLAGQELIGTIGRVRQDVLRDFSIKRDVYYFDLDLSGLCSTSTASKSFTSLPVYPSVKRDIALVVPVGVNSGDLVRTVLSSREKLVEKCAVFDVYQGDKIASGFKSVALTITYRSETKTLTEKNVEKVNNKLVAMLTEAFGGSFREA